MHLIVAAILLFAQHEHHMLTSSDVGEVRFPTSCAPAAAKDVQTAVALLHSFWYDEADHTFGRAIAADPKCAIAHWGKAMTKYHPLWNPWITRAGLAEGAKALAAARDLKNVSAHERAYIDALSAFYDQPEGTPVPQRALKYESAMASLVAKYPADDEAAIFYALALNGSALPTDKTYAKQKQAAAILTRLLPKHPHHPGIAHYLIHSYDTPELAPLALDAARSYAKIAPAVPHALHMPSHIFTRLGLWDESIASNLASARVAKERGATDQQLHAMDYLEYAYLQLGRDDDAKHVVDELRQMTTLGQINDTGSYAVAAIPARYPLEHHDWKAAAQLTPIAAAGPRTAALTQFAIGIGAARSGDVDRAKQAEGSLSDYVVALRKSNDDIWASQVEVQQKAVAAWRMFAEGKRDDALSMMRSAADEEDRSTKLPVTPGSLLPARELLGDMLLEMDQRDAAATEYKAVLHDSPNRRNAMSELTRASIRD